MKTAVLVVASILFALLLCEAGLRMFTGFGGNHKFSQPLGTPPPDKPLDVQDAARYIAQMPAAPGTDRKWFTEDPPPLPNRTAPSPEQVARTKDYERRGIYGPQADYAWNRHFVETDFCAPGSAYQNYPDDITVFNPPEGALHPRYRFPPNITTPYGLVTNQFGLRGPPIALVKPPKTIRIAFVGASTTINSHGFPFSYPERVVHWLNLFAQANHFDVRFEVLNGGREGIISEDIAQIVDDELLPLDPDWTVYYEGSNQFFWVRDLITPRTPSRQSLDPRDSVIEHKVPEPIRKHLAMGDLLDRALNGFGTLGEPRRPSYRLNWPADVDEATPVVDSPHLPAPIVTIIKDLDSIRASMASIGGRFALCSYVWMVKDGLRLSPNRHKLIYEQLNASLWPLRYKDIRRLADFQNRVFQRYAADRGIPFLDISAAMPLDPNLFVDAIHMTDTGERTKAWIAFQQLVPILRREIESGRLPRPAGSHPLPPLPSLAMAKMPGRCHAAPPGPLTRIDAAISLGSIESPDDMISTDPSGLVRITTAVPQWSNAAAIPISAPLGLARPCYLLLHGRVVTGQVGLGVSEFGGKSFQVERAVGPSPAMIDIYVPVPFPDRVNALSIRNVSPNGVRSQIEIESVALLASAKAPPEELVKKIDLTEVRREISGTAMEQQGGGLLLTTGPSQWGYAARLALGLDANSGAGLRVHVWMRVLAGRVGVGVVNPTGQAFLVTRTARPWPHDVELVLPLPAPPVTGDLIVRNDAAGNVLSKAIIEKIEIRRAPSILPEARTP
ncbi:MAG TPA: hypothetical protein VEU96_09340 [Bryobacteraceae bacterium]|nr:hypothetical protein [Bryobacteraceae bacterium]